MQKCIIYIEDKIKYQFVDHIPRSTMITPDTFDEMNKRPKILQRSCILIFPIYLLPWWKQIPPCTHHITLQLI